jgi:hypothetical protein
MLSCASGRTIRSVFGNLTLRNLRHSWIKRLYLSRAPRIVWLTEPDCTVRLGACGCDSTRQRGVMHDDRPRCFLVDEWCEYSLKCSYTLPPSLAQTRPPFSQTMTLSQIMSTRSDFPHSNSFPRLPNINPPPSYNTSLNPDAPRLPKHPPRSSSNEFGTFRSSNFLFTHLHTNHHQQSRRPSFPQRNPLPHPSFTTIPTPISDTLSPVDLDSEEE